MTTAVKEEIFVKKRNGRGTEPLNLDKVHVMVDHACKGLSGVSASQVEIQSELSFYDGITTADIQETLIRSASDLISLDNPNYQFVAARLLLFSLRKSIYHKMYERWSLQEQIDYGIEHGVYDRAILQYYTRDEIKTLDSYIEDDRDLDFTYAGLRQVYDKYLVQDRSTGQIYETPQFMYMLIAATIFHAYPKETRLSYVKAYYDAVSSHRINIPTPIMAGVRTPIRQYASCVLVDAADSLDSIFASDMAIGYYTSQRAGIGVNAGRIRALGSKIRDGEVQHTGVIPFLKKFEAQQKMDYFSDSDAEMNLSRKESQTEESDQDKEDKQPSLKLKFSRKDSGSDLSHFEVSNDNIRKEIDKKETSKEWQNKASLYQNIQVDLMNL